MYRAVCSQCGQGCEVPFRPTGDKPVYCNNCFGANRGDDRGRDRFPRRDFGSRAPMRSSFGENRGNGDEIKKQLEFLGLKIDRLTKVIEGLASARTPIAKEKSAQVKEALGDLANSDEVKVKTSVKKKVAKKKLVKKA